MKIKLLTLLIAFLFLPRGLAFAEEITQLDVDIVINRDATASVVETIHYDFGNLQKHGIYRDIPVKYTTDQGNNRSITLNNISVTDENGNKYKFAISREGKQKRIKIGDANSYVTGSKVYVISYMVDGAMNYFDTHDEFYWNAVATGWTVPINTAGIHINAPALQKVDCFFGVYGASTKCDSVSEKDGDSVTFTQENITPGKGVTTVIGMPVGTIHKPNTLEKIQKFLLDNWVIFIPLFVFALMMFLWSQHGKDPKGRGTIVPYYQAPEDLSPAEVGMIANDVLKKEHISALLIDLAVKGYMHIRRVKKATIFSSADYIFVKTPKDITHLSNVDERELFDKLFSFASNGEVKMSKLQDKFYKKMEKIMTNVREQVVTKGYYVKNPKTVRQIYIAIGVLILFCGYLSSVFFGTVALFSVSISGIIIIIFSFIMPQRTKKGAIVREQIFGLKLYMETAEKDRINFHNAPEKEPKKFEELLPYAMVLGVEKEWAKQFEDIYKGQNPEWYEGNDVFTPTMFASDMRSFSERAVSSMSSSPSSAGSGGSGFSGGGSGGGFGGGGGGSW